MMMNITKAFDTLCLENGCLDPVSRRSQIEELALCLTLSEIHCLRRQLEKHSAKNGNIFFEQLPSEICQIIANYLHLNDLVRIHSVSRSWRQIFSRPEFCLHIIKKHFQLAWEYYFKPHNPSSTIIGGTPNPYKWLLRASVERIKRERGLASVFKFKFEFEFNWQDLPFQYCNGRIAFQKDGIFEIEDLFTHSRSTITTLNRRTMHKWLLSNHLLVGIMFGPTELCVWTLSVDDKLFHSVRLPTHAHSISAHKNKVGIVTAAFEAIIWTVGGSLQSLKTLTLDPSCTEQKIVAANIFFQLNKQNHYFLVYHTRIDSGSKKEYLTRITVESFISQKLVQTQHVDISTLTLPHKHRSSLISSEGVIGIEVHGHPECERADGDNTFQILTYDMRFGHFERQNVQLHPTVKKNLKMCNYLIWRDQIYQPVAFKSSDLTDTIEIITISKSLIDIWNPDKKSPENFSLLRGETRSGSTSEMTDWNDKPLKQRRIWGDDNFVILFTGAEFVIWKFGRHTRTDIKSTPSKLPVCKNYDQ
ncbi:hypothetical protein K3495_g6184 [Podosphaera aphanis]|nr:hypothetical protein K3495_g6184 [Podosphaera aphanis]